MEQLPNKRRDPKDYRGDDHEVLTPEKPIDIHAVFTVRHFELPATYTYTSKYDTHEEYELIYVEKGPYLDNSEEISVEMYAGDAVIYGRGYPHRNNCDGKHASSIFIASFSCDSALMQEFFPDNTRTFVHITPEQRSILAMAFSAGVKAYDTNGHFCRLKTEPPHISRQLYINYIEILFLEIIKSLMKEKESQTEKVFFEHDGRENTVTAKVIAFLESRIYSSVSIDEICRHVGYSRGHVCNHFKKDTGKTVNAYYQLLKIEEAKRLILETTLDFSSISESLSFDSPQYFNKVFRKLTGYTPGAFRKTIFKGSLEK